MLADMCVLRKITQTVLALCLLTSALKAQATECGKCTNQIEGTTTVTLGEKTAAFVIGAQVKGTCKVRPAGPCIETSGCSGSAAVNVTGGGGSSAYNFTWAIYETDHGVEIEDLDPSDLKDSGSDSTGTHGNSSAKPLAASCNKSASIVITIMGSSMSTTMKCGKCPTITPEPL